MEGKTQLSNGKSVGEMCRNNGQTLLIGESFSVGGGKKTRDFFGGGGIGTNDANGRKSRDGRRKQTNGGRKERCEAKEKRKSE